MLTLYTMFILLPHIHDLHVLFGVMAGIAGVVAIIPLCISRFPESCSEEREVATFFYGKLRRVFQVTSVLFFISLFSPSKEDVYYLVGGYAITNSVEVAKLPENIVGAANDFLESYRSSITPKPAQVTKPE